jgi:tripartite-type tricarboxylate transporter receptor subunit TctC
MDPGREADRRARRLSTARRLGWAAALLALAAGAAAQPYPARPLRLVVPYPSGASSNDILARQLAPRLAELWGHNVVVDNRPGASGNIGAELVARAPADGYTLLLGTGGLISIGPSLYTKLAYDPHKDLAPVTLFAIVPYLLVVNPSVPAKTVQEFVAYAKARPGRLSFASAGVGSTPHLCGEMLKHMTGIDMLHVPYKGGAPAVTDTIAGQTQLYCAGLAATMPHVRSGKLRALGVTTLKRSTGAADLPTLDEQGLKGFDVNSWAAIFVPAKTPAVIVTRLHESIAQVMGTEAMRETLLKQGMDPELLGPKALAAYIREESARWSKLIQAAGIRAE